MKIYQKKIKGCDDSFFYEDTIAETDKHILIACGKIRINQIDKKGNYVGMYDGKARDEFDLDIKTDEDLEKIGNDYDDKYSWDMNNWFAIFEKDKNGDLLDEIDTLHSYGEAINVLKKLK